MIAKCPLYIQNINSQIQKVIWNSILNTSFKVI